MSRIDDLIAELCPEGVTHSAIRDVATIERGRTITKAETNPGNVPVLAGGRSPAYWHTIHNRVGEHVVVAGSGAYAGFVSYWYQPTWVSDAFTVIGLDGAARTKYLFYLLSNMQDTLHRMKRGSGVPHVYAKDVAQLIVPIPPLPVQEEIVRILDTFTKLEAELEAELEARTKQYAVTRDRLLTLDGDLALHPLASLTDELSPEGVDYLPLDEIGSLFSGLSGKSKADFENGEAPYVSYVEIANHNSLPRTLGKFVKVAPGEKQNQIRCGDVLFTGSSEDFEGVALSCEVRHDLDVPTFLNSFCFGWRPNSGIFSPGFLSYFFRSNSTRKKLQACANGVTRINISKKPFARVVVPIPPLPVQEEIVRILDAFDALVTDISVGLPAEIAARRKQYEYYRDKLLSFEELAA